MPYSDKRSQKNYQQEWYLKNKEKILQAQRDRRAARQAVINKWKLATGCFRCGFKEDAIALDAHHIGEKTMNICRATLDSIPLDTILKELEKCKPVCANCHRIITHR